MRSRCAGARIALLLVLLSIPSGPAAAERTGTPRLAGGINVDPPHNPNLGLHASAPGDTTVLGWWDFGLSQSCTGQGWAATDLTAGDTQFGDHGGLFVGRDQYTSELCIDNLGCLWGFVNGSTDTYVCGGGGGQPVIPYGDSQRGYIWNEIQSPPINMTGSGSVFGLRFSVYRDLRFTNLVFYTWRVRSWHAGVPGEWKDSEFLYYGPGVAHADWFIQEESIGALIERGADQIQVALGVVDMAGVWGGMLGDGACHSNAPYFDSVKVYRVDDNGPQWSVDFADLFQDNFASDGTVTGTVRMDMARDINPRNVFSIRPGDSLVVTVSEPTVGLSYREPGVPSSGPAVLISVRNLRGGKSGPALSDNPRWPFIVDSGGWTTLRFDSVRTASGVVPGRFCVDLNDNLYTPGDTVQFFFTARDAAGRQSYWSEFYGGSGSVVYVPLKPMEATCLPVTTRDELSVLYVDDTDGSGAQAYFDNAFLLLGRTLRVDRYDVRGSDQLVGNGPGSRVRNVQAQLADYYESIIWSSGTRTAGTIGDGSGAPEKSGDAAMLAEFIETKVPWGVVYLSGDHLAAELAQLTSASAAALRSYIPYDLVSETHGATGRISPQVRPAPGSAFDDSFFLFGGCPTLNSFGLLAPAGASIAEMLYDGTPYAAEVGHFVQTASGRKWVVISGSGFEFIRDDELNGVSDRALHLKTMLEGGNIQPCSASSGSIEREDAGARISWHVGNCSRGITIFRITPSGATEVAIHTAPVPPTDGVYHDPIPYAHTAWYRVESRETYGQVTVIASGHVTRLLPLTSFHVAAKDLGIHVSWTIDVLYAIESLTVQRRLRGEGVFTAASDDSLLPPGATQFVDRGFTPGKSYEYRLVVHYDSGSTAHGDAVAVAAPRALTLGQNFPNPFNPETRIPFLMPSSGNVNVTIFNVNGERVRTVWNGARNAGYTELEWDGRSDAGTPAASGIYFCRLRALGQTLTRKIVLVR